MKTAAEVAVVLEFLRRRLWDDIDTISGRWASPSCSYDAAHLASYAMGVQHCYISQVEHLHGYTFEEGGNPAARHDVNYFADGIMGALGEALQRMHPDMDRPFFLDEAAQKPTLTKSKKKYVAEWLLKVRQARIALKSGYDEAPYQAIRRARAEVESYRRKTAAQDYYWEYEVLLDEIEALGHLYTHLMWNDTAWRKEFDARAKEARSGTWPVDEARRTA